MLIVRSTPCYSGVCLSLLLPCRLCHLSLTLRYRIGLLCIFVLFLQSDTCFDSVNEDIKPPKQETLNKMFNSLEIMGRLVFDDSFVFLHYPCKRQTLVNPLKSHHLNLFRKNTFVDFGHYIFILNHTYFDISVFILSQKCPKFFVKVVTHH